MATSRVLTVAAFVLAAVPAAAQPAPTPPNLPRVEFGVGAGSTSWFGWAANLGVVDLRVTARVAPRLAVEFVTDFLTNELGADRANGLYIVQGAVLLGGRASRDLAVFATVGALGGFERYRSHGGSWTAPDGRVYTWPAESHTEIGPLSELVGGVAVQKVVAKYLAVRGDAQLIVCPHGAGVGMRLAAGVSVPLGSYGRPSSARN